MGEHSKSAIIKYTRMSKGMTQEELAEGICDPVTISRYETSKIEPSDENFTRLMQKMGERGEIYTFPMKCDSAEVEKKMNEMLYFIEKRDWDEVEETKDDMLKEYKVSMEYPENQQYLLRIDIIMKYDKGMINRKSAIIQLENAIKMTIKDYDNGKFSTRIIFSETEIMILYNIATFTGQEGAFEKSNLIFSKLRGYFLENNVINDYKPRYLVNTNYSNLLGRNKKYDESIKICQEEIQWLIKNNKTNCLYNLYYNIGWNIKQKIDAGLENKKKIPEAKCYIWVAYQLCKRYPENKRNLKKILELYNSF